MKGANTSTVVATMSNNPVTHKKMASGIIQRLSESLCQLCHRSERAAKHDESASGPATCLDHVTQPPSSKCQLVFLSRPKCASLRESLQRLEHRSCSAGMLSTLQLHD